MPKVSRRRNGRLQTAEERATPDHGADGPAQMARRFEVREWKSTGTTAKRMVADPHPETYPLDHYERTSLLTERQIFAGRRLALCYAKGFGFPRIVARLIGVGGATLSDSRAETQSGCRRIYCAALAAAPESSHTTLVEVVRGEWPKRTNALQYLREGLDRIADHWGFARVTVGGN